MIEKRFLTSLLTLLVVALGCQSTSHEPQFPDETAWENEDYEALHREYDSIYPDNLTSYEREWLKEAEEAIAESGGTSELQEDADITTKIFPWISPDPTTWSIRDKVFLGHWIDFFGRSLAASWRKG